MPSAHTEMLCFWTVLYVLFSAVRTFPGQSRHSTFWPAELSNLIMTKKHDAEIRRVRCPRLPWLCSATRRLAPASLAQPASPSHHCPALVVLAVALSALCTAIADCLKLLPPAAIGASALVRLLPQLPRLPRTLAMPSLQTAVIAELN